MIEQQTMIFNSRAVKKKKKEKVWNELNPRASSSAPKGLEDHRPEVDDCRIRFLVEKSLCNVLPSQEHSQGERISLLKNAKHLQQAVHSRILGQVRLWIY